MLTSTLRWYSACIPDASFPWLSIFDITELSKVVRQNSSAFPLLTHDECNFYNSADGATDKGNKDAESRRPNNKHESPDSAIDGAICSIEGMAMRSRHARYKEDRSMALKVLRHNTASSHDISKWSPTSRLLSPVFKPWNAYGSSLNHELLSIRRMETTAENSGFNNASLTQRIRATTSLQELANIFNQYTRISLGDRSRDATLQPSSLDSAAIAIRPTHLAQICGTITRLVELKTLSKSDMNLAVSLTEAITRELTVCVSDLNVEDLCELMGSWACLNISPSTTIRSEVLWWLNPTSGGRLRYASARHLASATRLLQRLGWLDSRLLALCVEAALKKSMTKTLDASSLAILMCSFWEVGHTDLKTYMSFSSLSNQLLPHMSRKELVTVLHTLSCAGASTLSHTFLSGSASKLLTFVDELTLEEVSFVAYAFAKCSFSHEFLFSGLSRRALSLIEDEAGSMDKLDIADLDNLGRIAESYSILDLYSPQLFNGLERAGRQLLGERDAAASFTFVGLQPLQQGQREVASKCGQPSLKKSSCVAWGSMQQVMAGPVRNAAKINQKRAMVQPANKFAGPSLSDVSHGGTHDVKPPSLSLLSRFAWSFSNSGHSAPLFLDHVADVLTSRDLIQGMNMASLGTLCEAYSTAKHRNNAFLAAIRRRATHFVSRFSNNASHYAEVGGGRDTESCFHPNAQFSSRQSSGSFASSFTLPPPLRSNSSAAALVSATDLKPSIQMLQILCLFGEDFEALLQVILPTLCHALETEPVPQPVLSNMTHQAVAKDNYALDLQDLEALIQPLTLTIQCSSGLFNKSSKAIGNNRVSSKHAQNATLSSNMSLDEEEETSSSINMHYMTLLVDVLDRLQDAPPNGWRSLLRISQAQVGQAVMALKDLGAYEQLGGGSRWHHEEHCVSAYDQLFADSLLLQPLSLSRHELGNDKSTVSRGRHVDDLRKCLQRELKELDLTSVVHHEKVQSQNLQSALVLVKVLGKTLAVDVWGPGMFPSNHGSISRHATSGHDLTTPPASTDDNEASGSSDIRTGLPADPEADESSSTWIDGASSLHHEDSASATALDDDEVVVQTQGASGLTSTLTSMPYSTAVCPPGALSAARVRLQAMILKGWLPVVIPYWVIVQSGSKNMTHQLRDHLLRRITAALSMSHDNGNKLI
ncbi:hypothetical protein CEUSTIGMA_g12251.t1 [Chlamydomonas eustigma]|uniref:RAP domain-containing protein n=1 Tax=Chlamydomonas eustigma TaxID=1157962 RepID=A0A250XPV3_9CHLO|nr:hypothetical protein CEUSTIGMA_g12251.t1 [Chlamydomonas eustigma]|eukprot:GAX84830.1 hypothetical protein CEUSTIGMA_g12251.t1 [Chlamydomonas eustigma]